MHKLVEIITTSIIHGSKLNVSSPGGGGQSKLQHRANRTVHRRTPTASPRNLPTRIDLLDKTTFEREWQAQCWYSRQLYFHPSTTLYYDPSTNLFRTDEIYLSSIVSCTQHRLVLLREGWRIYQTQCHPCLICYANHLTPIQPAGLPQFLRLCEVPYRQG